MNFGAPLLIGCGPNTRGSAVRTPRTAEPEGEREVRREREQGRFPHAWRNPRAPSPPEPRAPSPEPQCTLLYTFVHFCTLFVGKSPPP